MGLARQSHPVKPLRRIVNAPPVSKKGKALAEQSSGMEPKVPQDEFRVVGPDGQPHAAASVPVNTSDEHWNEYVLSDQTLIRLKPVATEVLKVEDMWDQEGNPVYIVKTQNIVVVKAQKKLRRKPE